jgi:hypothetical protein
MIRGHATINYHMSRDEARQRLETLNRIGFGSYDEYLASPLWGKVRHAAIIAHGEHCLRCGRKASSVHHGSYSEDAMRGLDLSELMPVCGRCHKLAHECTTSTADATAFLRKPWKARFGPKAGTPVSEAVRQARATKAAERHRMSRIPSTMRRTARDRLLAVAAKAEKILRDIGYPECAEDLRKDLGIVAQAQPEPAERKTHSPENSC